jgi:hypothetical protein
MRALRNRRYELTTSGAGQGQSRVLTRCRPFCGSSRVDIILARVQVGETREPLLVLSVNGRHLP